MTYRVIDDARAVFVDETVHDLPAAAAAAAHQTLAAEDTQALRDQGLRESERLDELVDADAPNSRIGCGDERELPTRLKAPPRLRYHAASWRGRERALDLARRSMALGAGARRCIEDVK